MTIESSTKSPDGGMECPPPDQHLNLSPSRTNLSIASEPLNSATSGSSSQTGAGASNYKSKKAVRKKKVINAPNKKKTRERKAKTKNVQHNNNSPKHLVQSDRNTRRDDLKRTLKRKFPTQDNFDGECENEIKSKRVLRPRPGKVRVPELPPRYVEDKDLIEIDFDHDDAKIKFMHCLGMDFGSRPREESQKLKESIPSSFNVCDDADVNNMVNSHEIANSKDRAEPNPSKTFVRIKKPMPESHSTDEDSDNDDWLRFVDSKFHKCDSSQKTRPSEKDVSEALQRLLRFGCDVKLGLSELHGFGGQETK